MSHTSEKRWSGIAAAVTTLCTNAVNSLLDAESSYQDLLELYNYVGNDNQALADQLFLDDWSSRGTAGTQAEITVDVVAGAVSNPVITVAGSGYTDSTGQILQLGQTAGGGDAILTYDVVAGAFANVAVQDGGTGYVDGTGISVLEIGSPGLIPDTQANADEVARAADLVNAMTALHEIYQAADNVAVGAEDRLVQLRRFT